MCSIEAVPIAMTVASSAASTYGEAQKVKEAGKSANKRYKQTTTAAVEAYTAGTRQLAIRQAQEAQAAGGDALAASIDAQAQRGAVRANAGARGQSGSTVLGLIDDFTRLELDTLGTIGTNLRWREQQLHEEALSLHADAQSRINDALPPVLRAPSLLPFAAAAVGAAASGYDLYRQRKPRANV